MGRTLKLAIAHQNRLVPSQGEDIGRVLEQLADQMSIQQKYLEAFARDVVPTHMLDRVATLYELASDAYQLSADVTMGHNRSDRYTEYSRNALRKAAEARKMLEQHT